LPDRVRQDHVGLDTGNGSITAPGKSIGLIIANNSFSNNYEKGITTTHNGSETPAKVMVINTQPGGVLGYEDVAILTMGNYTAFPTNPVSGTGGTGSGPSSSTVMRSLAMQV
jgi:hypothetical protein